MKRYSNGLKVMVCFAVIFALCSTASAFWGKKKDKKADKTAEVKQEQAPTEIKKEAAAETKKETPAAKPVATPEPAAVKEAAPAADSVAVTVNGYEIKESKVDAEIKPQLEQLSRQLPPDMIGKYKQELRQKTIDRMVVEHLLDEQVAKAGIKITDNDVNNQLKEIGSQQNPPMLVDAVKKMIEASGQKFDVVQERIKRGLGYQKVMEASFKDKSEVNDANAQKYYNENKSEFETPEQVKASHILIKTDPNITDPNQAKEKALAKAQDLLKQIKEGGNFEELAKANSACPSASRGGDLDYFGKGQMVEPFEKAAFTLKQGEVSDVVETKFGYHIIKVTDHKDPNTVPFDKAKGDIKKMLTQQKQRQLAKDYIDNLRSQATIVYVGSPEANKPAPEQHQHSESCKHDAPDANATKK